MCSLENLTTVQFQVIEARNSGPRQQIRSNRYRIEELDQGKTNMTDTKSGGTGGCLCGAVRYRYEGEPASIGLCQCRRCQRQSGSSFLIGVIFPKEAVTIEGRLATFEFETDGKRLWRHFCPVCGSAISITLDRFPAIRSMMGGTLDDKNKVKPTFSVWCSEGQPWLKLPKDIACFPDYPEGTFA